jgi:hypothetical protein
MTTLAIITVIRNLFNNEAPAAPAGLRIQAVKAVQHGDFNAFMTACKAAGINGLTALEVAFEIFPEAKAKAQAQVKAKAQAQVKAKAEAAFEVKINQAWNSYNVKVAIQELKAMVAEPSRKRKFAGAFEALVVIEPVIEPIVVDAEVEPVIEPVIEPIVVEPVVVVDPIPAIRLVPPVFNAAVVTATAIGVGLGPIAPAIAILAATLTASLEEERGALSAGVVGVVGGLAVLAATSVVSPLGVVALAPIAGIAVIGGVLSKIRS